MAQWNDSGTQRENEFMKKRLLTSLCLLASLPTGACFAGENSSQSASQHASQHASRPVMVTREVKQFSDLEHDLIAAMNAKDAEGMKQLLTDDFALHFGNNPGDSTNRTEMIAQATAGRTLPLHLEYMSALDYGGVAIVSFSWNLDGVDGEASSGKVFVVDTWKKIDEHWKLAARYASAVAKSDLAVPGYVPHAVAPNKKI
jgi:ketosteroid isomerase-like protein